jgi:transposase
VIELSSFEAIYLHREFVDFRKSIDGLSGFVSELKIDIFKRYLFVFCSRDRSKLKILYWDRTGFAIWYKRLEKERFYWPRKMLELEAIEIDSEKLRWLLDGIDVWKIRSHETLKYSAVL